jgi:hypothetical protein
MLMFRSSINSWAGPYPGQDEFKGEVFHSKSFKGPAQLKGYSPLTLMHVLSLTSIHRMCV